MESLHKPWKPSIAFLNEAATNTVSKIDISAIILLASKSAIGNN